MPTFFYRRQYGVATTLNFPLFNPSTGQAVTDAVHVSGDMTLMQDEGTPGTFTAGFTDEGTTYSIAPTAANLTCKRAVFTCFDQGTPAWLDTVLIVETEGDELAQHTNRDSGVILGTTVAVVNSQTDFDLTSGPNDNNTLRNCVAVFFDNTSPNAVPDRGRSVTTGYTGSGPRVTIADAMPFTVAVGDKVLFFPAADVASAADIADAVFDEQKADHTTDNSYGKIIQDLETNLATVDTAVGNISSAVADLSSDVTTVAPQTTARLLRPRQNAAYSNIEVFMVSSTDAKMPVTGITPTVERSIDGGSFASGTGSVAEVSDGIYQYDASAADMNGAAITFKFSGTGALDTFVRILTTP